MAVNALGGSVLINHNGFVSDNFCLNVTFVTTHVGVAAGKSEVSTSIVIKGRGNPTLRIVTVGAVSLPILGNELRIVSVLVASLTQLRGTLEA